MSDLCAHQEGDWHLHMRLGLCHFGTPIHEQVRPHLSAHIITAKMPCKGSEDVSALATDNDSP